MINIPSITINGVDYTNMVGSLLTCLYNFQDREGLIVIHVKESVSAKVTLAYEIPFTAPVGSTLSEEAVMQVILANLEGSTIQ